METIGKIHSLYQDRMDMYYKTIDKNLKPNVVYLGEDNYCDILNHTAVEGKIVDGCAGLYVFGLKIETVNYKNYIAVGCITKYEQEEEKIKKTYVNNRGLDKEIARGLGRQIQGETMSIDNPKYKGGYYVIPYYSTDIKAMLELDEDMKYRGYSVEVSRDVTKYLVKFWDRRIDNYVRGAGCSKSLPKAYALGAYKILTDREWQEV